MVWATLSKKTAAAFCSHLKEMSNLEFSAWQEDCRLGKISVDPAYLDLRERLMMIPLPSKDVRARGKYDLSVGMELFKYTMEFQSSMSIRDASEDGVWRYLSVKVVPDLAVMRFQKDNEIGRVSDDRIWKKSKRIWLRGIWWYIYLSLQFDETGKPDYDSTLSILKATTTDDIEQLVGRPGNGYRVDLTREIMKQYGEVSEDSRKNLLRKVMKMSTAKVKICEPAITKGGCRGYVKDIMGMFLKNETA